MIVVASIAITPQVTTLAVAGSMGAPPKRADNTPNNIKPRIVTKPSEYTKVWIGNSMIPITGKIPPSKT